MSRLKRVLEENQSAIENPIVNNPNPDLPVYNTSGKQAKQKKQFQFKVKTLPLIVVLALVAIIYVPQFFIPDSADTNVPSERVTYHNSADLNSDARTLHPTLDYDKDGLTNQEEAALYLDIWNLDSDGDGICDFYEVNTLKSDPAFADKALLDIVKKQDEKNRIDISSPYMMNNVILWADNYESKVYGGVIETTTGYRFTNFYGYAQFPDCDNIYVYKYENGRRSELKYLSKEKAWRIDGNIVVEVYDKPLEMTVQFALFGNISYVNYNFFTAPIEWILPDKGLIAAKKMAVLDTEPDTRAVVSAEIQEITCDIDSYTRLTHADANLNELAFVRDAIKDNACIAVSLYSYEYGEALAIVYGYTYTGDLLLADFETLKQIGVLKIEEKAKMFINQSGELVSYSYFDFSGLGFDSTEGDRISFFGASKTSESYNNHFATNLTN